MFRPSKIRPSKIIVCIPFSLYRPKDDVNILNRNPSTKLRLHVHFDSQPRSLYIPTSNMKDLNVGRQ